ncbi:MAG: MBL fold metallo-hydrolase [Fidelibacterota bacterium]
MLITIVLTAAIIILFVNLNPAFGGRISHREKQQYIALDNYHKGRFHNQIPTPMDMNFGDGLKIIWEFMRGAEYREPAIPLPVTKIDPMNIGNSTETKITWFGHSTFLIEIAGQIILIDPMFGRISSPIPFIGPRRYTMNFPIAIEQLPPIDLIVISHDHYDHLDMRSIKQLKSKTAKFIVPLGVDKHLQRWGVKQSKIIKLNWWEEVTLNNLTLVSTPARHFSGRAFNDRARTLWCSWIIKSGGHKIFFSGDTGYGPHFQEIYEKYGAVHLALLECGQYNQQWKNVHMFPEQTVAAARDLKASIFMPIHWSGFTLSVHDWTEPVMLVIQAAEKDNIKITTPQIGQTINLHKGHFPIDNWWQE